jgi:hypothetical protein
MSDLDPGTRLDAPCKVTDSQLPYWPETVNDALNTPPALVPELHCLFRCDCGYTGSTQFLWLQTKLGTADTIGELIGRYRCLACQSVPYAIAMSATPFRLDHDIQDRRRKKTLILRSTKWIPRIV